MWILPTGQKGADQGRGKIISNVQTLGLNGRKTISWLYIYTLYPSILAVAAAAAALLKGLFIWLDHRLTVWLCHLTGSGPDSLSHWGSAWRISCSAAQHNEEGQNIDPDHAEEQNWRYKGGFYSFLLITTDPWEWYHSSHLILHKKTNVRVFPTIDLKK